MLHPNPGAEVHDRIAQAYLRSAQKLARRRDPVSQLYALEYGVAAAEHAQYGDVNQLMDSVRLVQAQQQRILRLMGSRARAGLAVPRAWKNPMARPELDKSDEDAVREVVAQAQAGDSAAMNLLVSTYYPKMVSQAIVYARGSNVRATPFDIDRGHDIAQDAAVRLIEKLKKKKFDLSKDIPFGAWVTGIVRDAGRTWTRAQGKRAARHGKAAREQELLAAGIRPLLSIQGATVALAMRQALEQLPPAQQKLLVMADMEGKSTQEMADTLGVGRDQVVVRLHKARSGLQKHLHAALLPTSVTPEQIADASAAEQERLREKLEAELEQARRQLAALKQAKPKKNPKPRLSLRRLLS